MMWHPSKEFPAYLEFAPSKEKNNYFCDGFLLDHHIMEKSKHEVLKKIGKYKQYQILNIAGPTGIGKTELANAIVRYCFENAKNKVGLPAVYLEMPAIKTDSPRWQDIYTSFLRQLRRFDISKYRRITDLENPMKGRRYISKGKTPDETEDQFIETLLEFDTKVIVIDEIQHLFQYSQQESKKILDILKSLSNLSGCQIVLIGTYESLPKLKFNGQLRRRSKDINFRRYFWSDGDDRKGFIEAYSGLLSHVPYQISADILDTDVIQTMYENSCGCIGVLKQIIERAIDDFNEQDVLTSSDLLDHAMSTEDLIHLATEIREGEEYFEGEDDRNRLRSGLGIIQTKPSIKKKLAKKRKGRVGERNPTKDKVGV